MALYEFRGSFLPQMNVLKHFGNMPKCLPEYYNGFESDTCIEDKNYEVYYQYWDDVKFDEIKNSIKDIFTIKKNLTSDFSQIFGYEKGIMVEVKNKDPEDDYDSNEIFMHLDVINFDRNFLKKILEIFNKIDLIYVIEDTGKIISSEYESFIKVLESSKRYRQVNKL